MKISEDLIQYYLPYFKNEEDLRKALIYGNSLFDQKKNLSFVIKAVENHSQHGFECDQEGKGVINTDLYEINFAILPSGDFVYYTLNKKTKKKANYRRIMKLEAIYNHLIKLGVLDENVNFITVLSDIIFSNDIGLPSFHSIPDDIDKIEEEILYLSINSDIALDVEFPVLIGTSEIILNKEETQEKIGDIYFKLYNSNLLSSYELRDSADSYSADEEWTMSTFLELFEEEIKLYATKILMLNQISIKSSYRNEGFGKEAIRELIKLCEYMDVDYIILKPAPIENISFDKKDKVKRSNAIMRLVRFYEEFEFESYVLEEREPLMVLQLN